MDHCNIAILAIYGDPDLREIHMYSIVMCYFKVWEQMVDKRSELMDMANDIKIIGKTKTIK